MSGLRKETDWGNLKYELENGERPLGKYLNVIGPFGPGASVVGKNDFAPLYMPLNISEKMQGRQGNFHLLSMVSVYPQTQATMEDLKKRYDKDFGGGHNFQADIVGSPGKWRLLIQNSPSWRYEIIEEAHFPDFGPVLGDQDYKGCLTNEEFAIAAAKTKSQSGGSKKRKSKKRKSMKRKSKKRTSKKRKSKKRKSSKRRRRR